MTAKGVRGLWILMVLPLAGCDFSRVTVSCHEHIAAGDIGRYVIKGSGVVLDPDTGIEWYRCAFGQRHTPRGCTGDALLVAYDEVDSMLEEISIKAGRQWRLPTESEFLALKEPVSLRHEYQCVSQSTDR